MKTELQTCSTCDYFKINTNIFKCKRCISDGNKRTQHSSNNINIK